MPKTIDALRDEIINLKNQLGTWQKVGDYYDVSRAVVWRIANDNYEPKSNKLRHKLGLAEIITQEIIRDERGRFTKRT